MADLLSEEDKAFFRSSILDLFDTFKREIIIHKEPRRVIVNSNEDLLPGYGESSKPDNIDYVPVSQTFDAMISYAKEQGIDEANELGVIIPSGKVAIKVKQETRDYIMNGKTERIELDNKSFNLVSRDTVRYLFGLKLYVFFIEEVN